MSDDGNDDTDSTIVRRGKDAFRLAEMGLFARELQARPLAKLLEDLPGLLELPDSKYALVSLGIGKRMRASDDERLAIESQLRALLTSASALARERCAALLSPPG